MVKDSFNTHNNLVNIDLNKLISYIKRYAGGDFSEKPLIPDENGEFDELAASLSSMLEQVRQLMEEKQQAIHQVEKYKKDLEQYTNHLEYKVALRTEKLEKELCESRKREESLLESEKMFKQAEKLALLGHWSFDPEKKLMDWSDEIYHIFEVEPSQCSGSLEAFMKFVHHDDRNLLYENYMESVRNGKACGLDHRILLNDGRIKYVHQEWETYYDQQGNPYRSLGTVQHIAERMHPEDKNRTP